MLLVFDWSSTTRNDVARILSSQPVSAMGCYTGTIFNATSLQILSLKIVQCNITLKSMNGSEFSLTFSHESQNESCAVTRHSGLIFKE